MSNRQNIPNEWKKTLGTACCNCGSGSDIEYHHIVPLCVGGKDVITNVVPLCHACHMAAHNGRNLTEYKRDAGTQSGGRPPKVSDEEAFRVFDLWIDGQIGNRKCSEMLGLSQATKPNQTSQYRKYISMMGIKSVRNTFDVGMVLSPRRMNAKKVVGYITYEDGTITNIYFHDTGLCDDMEYEFHEGNNRNFHDTMTWGKKKAIIEHQRMRKKKECWWQDYRKRLVSGDA